MVNCVHRCWKCRFSRESIHSKIYVSGWGSSPVGSVFLACTRPWIPSTVPHRTDYCGACLKTAGSDVQGHPPVQKKLEVAVGFLKHWLKSKQTEQQQQQHGGRWRDGTAVRSIAALVEKPSSVPDAHHVTRNPP